MTSSLTLQGAKAQRKPHGAQSPTLLLWTHPDLCSRATEKAGQIRGPGRLSQLLLVLFHPVGLWAASLPHLKVGSCEGPRGTVVRCRRAGTERGEGSAHNRCSANRSGAGCGGGSGLQSPALCSRPCDYHAPHSGGLRGSTCGQACGQGARLASRQVPWALSGPGLVADVPGTLPSSSAATHRSAWAGGGGRRRQAGQTSQPSRLGLQPAAFLLGFLRPRGVPTSCLLPALLPSPLTRAGTEVPPELSPPSAEGSYETMHQPTLLPR